MQRVLTREQDQLLRRERSMLEDLQVLLVRLGASDEDLEVVKQALRQLDELFLLVVVGEFNAGKTAFLNAMLGDKLLTEGVLPTTSEIQILRHGEEASQAVNPDGMLVVQLPVEWLREINLVDTPGTNAVIQRHQEITELFVPRSDLVLFVTSADRPFSESERAFLERIRSWGKKIVVVVNKIDLIESQAEREQIIQFVSENARQLLGIQPEVFAVSARLALQAKQGAQSDHLAAPAEPQWSKSQFSRLEQYILQSLDTGARVRLKLDNPLGVSARMVETYGERIASRKLVLRDDFNALDVIEDQLAAYEGDMRRDFKYHLSHVENVLYAMAERGDHFFDDTLSIWRVWELLNGDKLRAEFEREVVADTAREVDRYMNELIDWMVESEFRQWRGLTDYLNRRAEQHADQLVGKVGTDFELSRQGLIASVGQAAQGVVDSYNPRDESAKLLQQVQGALIQTAAIEVSALGLGAVLVAMLHTALLDFTGILGAGVVAALGFYVMPYRRNKLKTTLRSQIAELRTQLDAAVSQQFETELADSIQRMREAVAPYTRFVRTEREKLERTGQDMDKVRHELAQLRTAVARAA
ncbi:MAG: dynamin family protein [Anaerolineales bacterium]|nr:dynamin family protein [Anaerolineales bacterium]